MNNTLEVAIADGIATVTLNRPDQMNALDDRMVDDFVETMPRVAADADVRVVVLAAAGKHFMAGGDIKFFAERMGEDGPTRGPAFKALIDRLHPAILAMREMDQPIVAKVRGAAAGFGLSLVLASDLAVAADDAYFTTAYCHLGTSPDGGSTWSLPRAVGTRKAMELALLGDRFDAAAARELGIVNRVVAGDALDDEVVALASRLAAGPRRAYAHIKRLIVRSHDTSLADQLAAEAEAFADCATTADFTEGLAAFAAKRKPVFGRTD